MPGCDVRNGGKYWHCSISLWCLRLCLPLCASVRELWPMSVCVYAGAYPLTNDRCNNRRQSCKVGGPLVNSEQRASRNSPVTWSKWTRSRTPQPELPPQTRLYNGAPPPPAPPGEDRSGSPRWLLSTFMIKRWQIVKFDGWRDLGSHEVRSRCKKQKKTGSVFQCRIWPTNAFDQKVS